jgi:hypothetical protein
VRLDLVARQVASRERTVQGGECGGALVVADDQGLGAQAVAGAVQG